MKHEHEKDNPGEEATRALWLDNLVFMGMREKNKWLIARVSLFSCLSIYANNYTLYICVVVWALQEI